MSNIFTPGFLSFSTSPDFYSLCSPLLKDPHINSVVYNRIYGNGDYFLLNTYPSLNHFAYVETEGKYVFDYRIFDAQFSQLGYNKDKIYLFNEDINETSYWDPVYNEFNIRSSFSIVEKIKNSNTDHYDCFWFACPPGKSGYNFFVNNLDLLNNFVMYFKETGTHLILEAEKNRIRSWTNNSTGYCKLINDLNAAKNNNPHTVNNIKSDLKLKRYPLELTDKRIAVTSGELKCLRHLAKGFSYKEIGRILGIVDRTVEHHINRVKHKAKIHSQTELLRIYHNSNLTNIDPN